MFKGENMKYRIRMGTTVLKIVIWGGGGGNIVGFKVANSVRNK